MGSRTVVAITVLVALFTLISAGSFGFYLHPYDPDSTTYAVAHESTEAFEGAVEHAEVDGDEAVDTDTLSSDAYRIFEDATQQPTETKYGWTGWKSVDVAVCQESMLVCDGYEEPPEFPTHGRWDGGPTQLYTMVEHDDELYVVETRRVSSPEGLILITHPTILLVLVFSGLLAQVGYRYRNSLTTGFVGISAIGLLIGLWPYFVMAVGLESYWWAVLPLLGFGNLALVYQMVVLSQRTADDMDESRFETESDQLRPWGLLLFVVVTGILLLVLPSIGRAGVILGGLVGLWLVIPKRTE